MSENIPENIHTPSRKFEILEGDTLSKVADNLGIKLSAIEDLYMVRVGEVYTLEKGAQGYSLKKNKKEIKRLTEEEVFLDTYKFPGFGFSMQKNVYMYEFRGKNGEKTPYSLSGKNIDIFREKFGELGGKILTESRSLIAQQELAHEVGIVGGIRGIPGGFSINSTSRTDIISSSVSMQEISRLIIPGLKSEQDMKGFLAFFLGNLDTKK